MKKITALIMMAVLVTIGGVYASWIYATGSLNTFSANGITINIDSAQSDNQTTIGTFSMSDATEIDIDDIDDGKLHNAVLVCDGSVTITFTPNVAAGNADIENIGIPMSLKVSFTEKYFKEKKILSVAPGKEIVYSPTLTNQDIEGGTLSKDASAANELGTYTKNTNGTFSWTLSSEVLLSLLVLNEGEELYLESIAEHNAFVEAISGGRLIVFQIDHVVD